MAAGVCLAPSLRRLQTAPPAPAVSRDDEQGSYERQAARSPRCSRRYVAAQGRASPAPRATLVALDAQDAASRAGGGGVTTTNARRLLNATQREDDFQAQIVQLAEDCGWLVWHDNDSRRNDAGLPDLLLIRGAVLLFLEVKTEKGKVSPAQEAFIGRLKQVKYVEADIVRPRHFEQVAAVLRSRAR